MTVVHSAFIMRTETEPKTAVFLAKPTETDRRQNFWNRNNTSLKKFQHYDDYS